MRIKKIDLDKKLKTLNLDKIEEVKQKVLFLNEQIEQGILPTSYVLNNLIKENEKLLLSIKQEKEEIKKQQKETEKQEYKAHLTALYSRLNLYEKNLENNLIKLNKFLELVDTNAKNQGDNSNLIDIYDIDEDNKIDIEEIDLLHKNINFLKKQDKNFLKQFTKFKKPNFNNVELINFISLFKEYNTYLLNSKDLIKLFSSCKDNLKEFYYGKNTIDKIRKENETIVYKIKKMKEIKEKWEKYNNLIKTLKENKIDLEKFDINNFSSNNLFLNIYEGKEEKNNLFLENLKTLGNYFQVTQKYNNLIEKTENNISILNTFGEKNYLKNKFLNYTVDLAKFIKMGDLKTLDNLKNINKSLENIINIQNTLINTYNKYYEFLNKFGFKKEETKQVSNQIDIDNIINQYNSTIYKYKQIESVNNKLGEYGQNIKQININKNDLLNGNFENKRKEYKEYLINKIQELSKILDLKSQQNNLISKVRHLKSQISSHGGYSSKSYNLTNDLVRNITILSGVVSYLNNNLEEAIEEERKREEENSFYNNSSNGYNWGSWSDSSDSFGSDSSWTSSGEESW